MKTLTIDKQESSNKLFAFLDARRKSYAASTHYSEAERTRAERMKLGLEMVYSTKTPVMVTYRNKFISIKLDSPKVRDRQTLKLLEQDYDKAGIVKVETNCGILYRIPKAK